MNKQEAWARLRALGMDPIEIINFWTHMDKYPEEWPLYEKCITVRIEKGERRITQMAVVDDVRKHRKGRGDEFKTNNNWAPAYMRLYAAKHLEHRDKFEFRRLKEAA